VSRRLEQADKNLVVLLKEDSLVSEDPPPMYLETADRKNGHADTSRGEKRRLGLAFSH
jgi:hypothetical protein